MVKTFLQIAAAAGVASAACAFGTEPVLAGPAGLKGVASQTAKGIVLIHGDWDDDEDEEYRERRSYRRHRHVDAPFTHVESGRRVIVDAPFAHVYVGRHGRRIVAPFVDLRIPR